jgi:type I restriction enzyme R subunit
MGGQAVIINPEGRFILCLRDGRETLVPVDEYRREMIQRVLAEAHNLSDFRSLWIETQRRRQLIEHLLGAGLVPDHLREHDRMEDFDLFDFFGHHGYKARALRKKERGELYISGNEGWFAGMNPNAATVLRCFGNQFSFGGTEALETTALWDVPEIRMAGGMNALRVLGAPAQVIFEAKGRLFGV